MVMGERVNFKNAGNESNGNNLHSKIVRGLKFEVNTCSVDALTEGWLVVI